jgi:hypothetical protein
MANNDLMRYYWPIYNAVEKLNMGLTHLLFIKGRAGIGKSYHIKLALKRYYQDNFFLANKVSEAYLYRILCEQNGRPIWLRDCLNLFRGQMTLEMLKSASETDSCDRIVTNFNYSRDAKDLPQKFLFNGQIIFDFNQMVNLKFADDFDALISRGEYAELVFSFEEMCQIMKLVCSEKWQRNVTEWLIRNIGHIGPQCNLRTQQLAFRNYHYAVNKGLNWKKYLKSELQKNMSPTRSFLYQFMGKNPIKITDLKKTLIRNGVVQTSRTAERRIRNWLELEELYRISGEERNCLVALYPKKSVSI